MKDMKQKKIAIIATGGTIAGSGKPGEAAHYQAGTVPVEEVVKSANLQDLAEIELIPLCSKDSNDITEEDLWKLKEIAEELENRKDIDGIVITHGTDTLEETAYFLNIVSNVTKPFVITGAMRPASAVSADGPMNLYQAVALAANEAAEGLGLLAVFSDTIYSARDIAKKNSVKTDAFEKSMFGNIGYMRDGTAYFVNAPNRRHTLYSRFTALEKQKLPRVGIYYIHAGCDPALLSYMLENYDGLILAGSGSGNYSSKIRSVIENYKGKCQIVRATRLSEGGAFESEVFDPQNKCILAYQLSPHKARILLQLALASKLDEHESRRLFLEY